MDTTHLKTTRLRELIDREGSDKGCYCPAYEVLLRDRRHTVEALLEIGIGSMQPGAHSSMYGYAPDTYKPGASLRAWRDYFPGAQIYGVDVQPDTQFSDDRIRTFLCDSTSCQSVKELRSEHLRGVFFDVIVDDGSHRSEDQLETLSNFYPLLRNGGFYFIEDIGESKDLYRDYRLISPFVGCANYFEISDHDPVSKGRWKMIVIQKTSD